MLIATARDLYRDEPFGVELSETVYALGPTTIDLRLSLFPWGKFRRRKTSDSSAQGHAFLKPGRVFQDTSWRREEDTVGVVRRAKSWLWGSTSDRPSTTAKLKRALLRTSGQLALHLIA